MIGAGSNILLNFVFIPLWGAMGAALATAASYAIIQLIRMIHSRQILTFEVNYKRDAMLFLILMIQTCAVLIDEWWSIVASLALTMILLYLSRSIFYEMRKLILNKLQIKK